MSLKIMIGKNKTGKTKYLREEYNNKNNPKILFIGAELDFDGVLSGNLGTAKNEDLPPHRKIFNFLNEIIDAKYELKLKKTEQNRLSKFKNVFDDFLKDIKNDEDMFFEECFRESLSTIDFDGAKVDKALYLMLKNVLHCDYLVI